MDHILMIDSYLSKQPGAIIIRYQGIKDEDFDYICGKISAPDIKEIAIPNDRDGLGYITHDSMLRLSTLKWNNLAYLDLNDNTIGDRGCKYLTKAHAPNLKRIQISSNKIGDGGFLHISKGVWKQLILLSISLGWRQEDKVRTGGQHYLMRGHWRSLVELSFEREDLTVDQAKKVLLCEFPLEFIGIGTAFYNEVFEDGMNLIRSRILHYLEAKFPNAYYHI